MQFRLESHQLTIEEGDVYVVRDVSSPAALRDAWLAVRIKRNETEDIQNVTAGEVDLLFSNCLVRFSSSNTEYRIPLFRLRTLITENDSIEGVAPIVVGFHGLARIEAVGLDGKPLAREHLLGVSLPEPPMSLEVKGPENSPLYVLLPPGEYLAYLSGSSPVQVPFSVREHEEGVKTVRLSDAVSVD